ILTPSFRVLLDSAPIVRRLNRRRSAPVEDAIPGLGPGMATSSKAHCRQEVLSRLKSFWRASFTVDRVGAQRTSQQQTVQQFNAQIIIVDAYIFYLMLVLAFAHSSSPVYLRWTLQNDNSR